MAVAQQGIEQAKALAREGKSQAAVALLSKLIQVDAGNAEAWLALAQVVEEPDRIDLCLQKVLKLDPGNSTALDMLSKTKGGSLSVGSVGGLSSGRGRPEQESTAPVAEAAHTTPPESDAGVQFPDTPEQVELDRAQGTPEAGESEEKPGGQAPEGAEQAAQPEAAPGPQAELAEGTKPRWSFGRTDLILIGLTVLAGLTLCGLVGVAVVRNFSLF